MMIRAARFVTASLLVAALAGCGDDTSEGAGGAGGDGSTSSGTTASTGSTTTSASSGGEGGSGDGGSGAGGGEGGAGGAGGGTSACVGELPAAYDGADFATNAATELALREQLGALNDAMAAAEKDPEGDLVVLEDDLVALYEAGDPSLADGMTAYYDFIVRDVFVRFEAASNQTWTPQAELAPPDDKFGATIFDEYGRDLRQWVEKGHFDAFFYPHAVSLVEGGLDAAAVDRLLATYGAHPDFPGDSSADTAANPDRLVAQYAERRSPKDTEDPSQPLDPAEPGVYFRIKNDFILLQAAVAKGCDAERDEAATRILTAWEREAMAGTVIYYLNDAASKLTSDASTEVELAQGLHGIGEATSFLHGFYESPETYRTITDAEIETVLVLLQEPQRFVVDSVQVSDIQAAIDELATVYGFSDAEVEAFETNH